MAVHVQGLGVIALLAAPERMCFLVIEWDAMESLDLLGEEFCQNQKSTGVEIC